MTYFPILISIDTYLVNVPNFFQILQKSGGINIVESCAAQVYFLKTVEEKKRKNKDATINNPIRVNVREKCGLSLLMKIKAQSLTLPPPVTHFSQLVFSLQ